MSTSPEPPEQPLLTTGSISRELNNPSGRERRPGRARVVLGFTLGIGLGVGLLFGASGGLWAALLALMLGTIVTVPGDPEAGDYDLFGCGVFALMLVLGLSAGLLQEESTVRYTKDTGLCDERCEDFR